MKYTEVLNKLSKPGVYIRRKSWPIGAFVWRVAAAIIPVENLQEPKLVEAVKSLGLKEVDCQPMLRQLYVGTLVSGWMPTLDDEMSDDWEVVIFNNP